MTLSSKTPERRLESQLYRLSNCIHIPGGNIEAMIGAGADTVATTAQGILDVPGNAQVNVPKIVGGSFLVE